MNDEKCDYYKNKRTGLYFYHDFPAGVPLHNSYPMVAEKYARRITRFFSNIRTHERVLLVWFSHYHDTPDDEWLNFANKFCKKVNKNVDFLIIQHRENQFVPQKTIIASNIIRYDVHTVEKDKNGNNTTIGNEKLCNPIFAQFSLRVPRNRRINYAYKQCLIHGICKFIPIKSIRHAWRKKLQNDIYNIIYNRKN